MFFKIRLKVLTPASLHDNTRGSNQNRPGLEIGLEGFAELSRLYVCLSHESSRELFYHLMSELLVLVMISFPRHVLVLFRWVNDNTVPEQI